MDSFRNLPIILHYQDDGTVIGNCPLLPSCSCRALSRAQALRAIQELVRRELADTRTVREQRARTYEVIHLAVAPTKDSDAAEDDRVGFSRGEWHDSAGSA